MARVLKGFHSFTCTPTRSSAIGMSHTCLCLPSYSWYSFIDPGGMEGWVDLGPVPECQTILDFTAARGNGGGSGALGHAKLLSELHHQHTNTQLYLHARCPVSAAQSTVSESWFIPRQRRIGRHDSSSFSCPPQPLQPRASWCPHVIIFELKHTLTRPASKSHRPTPLSE